MCQTEPLPPALFLRIIPIPLFSLIIGPQGDYS